MTQFIPRNIKDEDVEFPGRYDLINVDTGDVLGTFDIVPNFGNIYEPEPTERNKGHDQPIEDFLGELSQVIPAHINDAVKHVTNSERNNWNTKVNQELPAHLNDMVRHITNTERSNWDAKVNQTNFNAHIANSAVHVTQSDRDNWMIQYGKYTGNGASNQTIYMTSPPTCVIVFANGKLPTEYISASEIRNYWGVGINISGNVFGTGSKGISVSQGKIQVSNNPAPDSVRLNESGVEYHYIAFGYGGVSL